ncbi:MAG: NUDIX domain-containing protein [Erysipelotrichaceae bacterium]|jgi:8-oxo-dGTP diphosphatase|nr:NUDIX domain-containing protein [Erysipelotrichaceae bacterium]
MDYKEIYDYIVKIQSIAKIGLVFSKDPYALTNYQQINDISADLLEHFMELKLDRPNYFQRDIYPTPSISVRTIIFNDDRSKVLMVREKELQAYSLPGGWADLYDTPSETAKNESKQEAGVDIEIVRLVGLTSRTPFKSNKNVPEYVAIFEAKAISELGEHEYETDDVNWFDIDNLPLISRKTTKEELLRFILAAKNGETIYD